MPINDVISNGLCVGCGACAVARPKHFQISMDRYGKLGAIRLAEIDAMADAAADQVCPFSDISKNETDLAKQLFLDAPMQNEHLGYYCGLYAGHVEVGDFRMRGSSGGIGSWILSKLLQEDMVDGVIHVGQRRRTVGDERLFEFKLSRTLEDVTSGAKSKYYPVELSAVLNQLKEMEGRYALVGVPCFIKAARLLAEQNPFLAHKLGPFIGLLCGQLKSKEFGSLLAWQAGVAPEGVRALDFRVKLPDQPASAYAFRAEGLQAGTSTLLAATVPMATLFGRDWGWGVFKYKACDYCDDVFAETADLVIGDAWLPRYETDSQGTNVLMTRTPLMEKLISEAWRSGELILEPLDVASVLQTQDASLRHRRGALSYRLALARRKSEWVPNKRVAPHAAELNWTSRLIQRLRIRIMNVSHEAFQEALRSKNLKMFVRKLKPYTYLYRIVYRLMKSWKGRI